MFSKLRTTEFRTAAKTFGKTVFLTSLVVTGLVVGARYIGILEGQELSAFDGLMRSRPDEKPDPRLLVVEVSEADIQKLNRYPITDAILAQALEKLEQYQPQAIGLDIARDVPQGEGREKLVKILTAEDNIISGCKLSSANDPGTAAAPGVPQERIGFADNTVDPGGILRRSQLVAVPLPFKKTLPNQHFCNVPDPNNQIPSLSLLLALDYLGSRNITQELMPSGDIKLGSTVFKRLTKNAGGYRNADVNNYQTLLNYRAAKNAVEQVTLTEVLEDKIKADLVKDRIVLIGYTAALVKDDFLTPYSAGQRDSQNMPGVVVHAQNVSQILSAVLDNRPLIWYWNDWSEILWTLGWSLIGGILAWRIRRPWLLVLGGAVAAGVLYGTCYLLFIHSGWIPLVPPAIALVATMAGVILVDEQRGYAKAIVQGVKVFLHIDIDPEETKRKVEQLDKEINLDAVKEKGKRLRGEREEKGKSQASNSQNESISNLIAEIETVAQSQPPTVESTDEQADWDDLRNKAKTFKTRKSSLPSSDVELKTEAESPAPTHQIAEATEADYFQQFQNPTQDDSHPFITATPKIVAPQNLSPVTEATDELDFFQQFQKKMQEGRNLTSSASA